jgi:hypothetical protein
MPKERRKSNMETNNENKEQVILRKVGNIIYKVVVHFKPKEGETFEEKVKRMLSDREMKKLENEKM